MDGVGDARSFSKRNTDLSIIINLLTSCLISVIYVIVFLIFKRTFKGIYAPNIQNLGSELPIQIKSQDWWIGSQTLPDSLLLTIVGLDGFVFLLLLKTLFKTFAWMSAVGMCILIPVYVSGCQKTSQVYTQTTLFHLGHGSSWMIVPLIMTYLFSFYLFYMIRVYCGEYTRLRQVYLVNPASLTSIYDILKLYEITENIDKVYSIVNAQSRTVFLEALDAVKLKSETQMISFMDRCGLGKIQDAVFVQDHHRLQELVRERDGVLKQIEKIYMTFLRNVLVEMKRAETFRKPSRLPEALQHLTVEDLVKSRRVFGPEERQELLRCTYSPGFLSHFRPRRKKGIWGFRKEEDVISCLFDQLVGLDGKIELERHAIAKNNKRTDRVDFVSGNGRNWLVEFLERRMSIFAFGPRYSDMLKNFGLLFHPENYKGSFITFENIVSSNIAQQCVVDSEILTCFIERAPYPHEIVWDNILLSFPLRMFKALVGVLIFILINVLWSIPISVVLLFNDLKTIGNSIPFLEPLSKLPKDLRAGVEGFLSPLLLFMLMKNVPRLLARLSIYQGHKSYAQIQISTLQKYMIFLYLQVFLVDMFSMSPVNILVNLMNLDLKEYFWRIKESLVSRSSFYLNVVILRISTDIFFSLANPLALIAGILGKGIYSNQTPREKYERQQPRQAFYGRLYPKVLLIFPLVLTYAVIAPLILVAATVYYGIAYIAYRYQYVYAQKTVAESGEHLGHLITYLCVGIFTFQFMTCVQMSVQGNASYVLLVVPLLMSTVAYHRMLQLYCNSKNHVPLQIHRDLTTYEADGEITKDCPVLTHVLELLERQKVLLSNIVSRRDSHRVPGINSTDISDIDATGSTDETNSLYGARGETEWHVSNPYRNPALLKKLNHICLPNHFFSLVQATIEQTQ